MSSPRKPRTRVSLVSQGFESRIRAAHARLLSLLVSATLSGCGMVGYESVRQASTDCIDAGTSSPCVDAGMDANTSDAATDASSLLDCSAGDCRRVFVTAAAPPTAGFGGLAAADAFCQAAAASTGLGGTWRAFLSDSTTSAESRLSHATVPYRLLDGTVVANDFADLVDGTLAHAIDRTESGAQATGISEVWTGTWSDGTPTGASCQDWTNGGDQPPFADIGHLTATDSAWTSAYLQFCNRSDVRFYCFEQ